MADLSHFMSSPLCAKSQKPSSTLIHVYTQKEITAFFPVFTGKIYLICTGLYADPCFFTFLKITVSICPFYVRKIIAVILSILNGFQKDSGTLIATMLQFRYKMANFQRKLILFLCSNCIFKINVLIFHSCQNNPHLLKLFPGSVCQDNFQTSVFLNLYICI